MKCKISRIDVLAPANISKCENYRYSLYREVNPKAKTIYAFIGINPSTADHRENDQTIKKMMGFVRRWGGKGFVVVNVFAYRSKDVKQLAATDDPSGRDNHKYIDSVLSKADVIVQCWGSRNKLGVKFHPALDAMILKVTQCSKTISILGKTASGDPLHPLTVAYDKPMMALF